MVGAITGGFDANLAFIICLVLGIMFLILAVLFFFLFDIPKVYLIRTGKGAKKTIRKMEAINAETGRLRRNNENYTLNNDVPLTGEIGRTPSHSISQVQQPMPQQAQQPVESTPEGNSLTTVLGNSGTTVIHNSETTVLSQDMVNTPSATYVYKRETTGRFDVTFNLMLVHSDEFI